MLNTIDVQDVVSLARKAGDAIMEIYIQDFEICYKEDCSPLTYADRKSHDIITEGLEKLAVNLPIVSEEGGFPSFEDRKAWSCFWLVDPLDGTKEFVKKNDEFTVNIALICNGSPVLGVVYAPALDICYWAKRGEGAFKNGKEIDSSFKGRGKYYKIVVSRSHISSKTEKFIESIQTTKKKKIIPMGSSLKICLVVEGEADIYPRLGTTMEWDIGAAHAIASEAGVNLQCFDGVEFSDQQLYNKVSLVNEWFVLWADRPIFKG